MINQDDTLYLEKRLRIAKFQYPGYNWRHTMGEGVVPGEEYDEAATRMILPDYFSCPEALESAKGKLNRDQRIRFGNTLFALVHGHPPGEGDDGEIIEGATGEQKVEALFQTLVES